MGSIMPSLLFLLLALLCLFNVFWVNIRQEEGWGGTAVISFLPSPEESFLFFFFHLILTEATTITTCHPFDSFCHQLAAKSASPQTRKLGNLYVYYLAYVQVSFPPPTLAPFPFTLPSLLYIRKNAGTAINLAACRPARMCPCSGARCAIGRGTKPRFHLSGS